MLDQPVPQASWQGDLKEPTGGQLGSGWHGCRSRLAWLPVAGLYCSSHFPAKNWCSAHCLAFLHTPVRAANPSSAAQLPQHMSKQTGADPARSAPQPVPQTILAAGQLAPSAYMRPLGQSGARRGCCRTSTGASGVNIYTKYARAVCHVRLPKPQSSGRRDVSARQRVWSRARPGRRQCPPIRAVFPTLVVGGRGYLGRFVAFFCYVLVRLQRPTLTFSSPARDLT
jgi:hypothetical protein